MLAFGNYFVIIIYVMGTTLGYHVPYEKMKNTFFKYIIKEHNKYRKIHGSKPLHLDIFCSRIAKEPLKEMLSEPFSKDYLKVCGVNKYKIDLTDVSEINAKLAKKIVKFWYEKGKYYNYLAEPTNNEADSFTQIVWKDTSLIGLQMLLTTKGELYVVATYIRKGNRIGTYVDNVKKPEINIVKNLFGNILQG